MSCFYGMMIMTTFEMYKPFYMARKIIFESDTVKKYEGDDNQEPP